MYIQVFVVNLPEKVSCKLGEGLGRGFNTDFFDNCVAKGSLAGNQQFVILQIVSHTLLHFNT